MNGPDPPATHAYLERVRGRSAIERDPVQPGWSGLATLFGARTAPVEDAQADVIIAGVPYDATASSRPGANEGPLAIRAASRIMASQLKSWGAREMYDPRTGTEFSYVRPDLCDVGDLPIYPTDPLRTFDALVAGAAALLERAEKLVFLGGDHSIAFPLFVGVAGGHLREVTDVGYIQIDNHFDFGDWSEVHGHLYHGSNARRISQVPGVQPRRMAFVGVGHPTRREQYRGLVSDGYHIVSVAQLRREGAERALASVRESMIGCRTVYLSIDIDVLDAASAPGTGAVTMGGLDSGTLLDVLTALAPLPIGAIDLVEVAPRYDPGGRTAQLAAQLLFELLFRTCP